MQDRQDEQDPEELLKRALLDPEDAAAVALKVDGLALARALTVVFHGRRDLGTIQTYVAHGGKGAGDAVGAGELLRVPCDLDLGDAVDRTEAEELYAAQARTLRDALLMADTVLSLWAEALEELADTPVGVDRSVHLRVPLPAPRLMPIALVAPEQRLTVAPVCSARTLSEGRPPMGIALSQQDVGHIYPLAEDPAAAFEDFRERAADHARTLRAQLDKQAASVDRFLELNGDDRPL